MRLPLALLVLATLTACRAPAVRPLRAHDRPADFTLAATVYSDSRADPASRPRALRPARYIVEADGALRAAVGPGAATTTYPTRTRQLSAAELDRLWRLIAESNLFAGGHYARVENPDTYEPLPRRTTALLALSHGGRREAVAIPIDRPGPDAAAARSIVDHLADLAWIRD